MWAVASSVWANEGAAWDVVSSMRAFKVSIHDAQALREMTCLLCGLLHALCRLLKPMFMLRGNYVGYCIPYEVCFILYVG